MTTPAEMAWERVSRRQYLEEQLELAAATAHLIQEGPSPTTAADRRAREKRLEELRDRWDTVFCRLRNHTNPKYGGDPEWRGVTQERARHAAGRFAGPPGAAWKQPDDDGNAERLHAALAKAEQELAPAREGEYSAARLHDACAELVDCARTLLRRHGKENR